jgi:hypothetical protein
VKKLVIVVGAIAMAIPALSTQPAKAAPPATPITFNPNLLLAGSQGAGEPSIKTDTAGTHYVIGPTGFPTGGCHAFRVVHNGSSSADIGFPDHNVGGGDCDWAIGPKETTATNDNLAYSSLLLTTIVAGKSGDGGSTFSPPNTYSANPPLDDRMWNVADPKNNAAGLNDVFMNYHDLNTDQIWQVTSTDGGLTYATTNAVINPSDVTTTQWASSCPGGGCVVGGPSLFGGNGIGNIVARRPTGGSLTLYTTFTTPDSAADNMGSNPGQNRIFEAVGTVVDAPGTGTPLSITWHDYELWRDPVGTMDTEIFPVTSVDAAGNVYALWSDAKHIYEKSSTNGVNWGCTDVGYVSGAVGNCNTFSSTPQQIDMAAGGDAVTDGVNTSIMPWVAAGAGGSVDVVWYGAHGGAVANNNDPNALWNVYFAQTIDAFGTWKVIRASDHQIHKGVLCTGGTGCSGNARILLDFFQVDIDPTTGAADIAYTDDHLNPGAVADLYFTRQCTGSNALDPAHTALIVNDCVAPPQPPPPPNVPFGVVCGPQILDPTGDAPNNFPGGMGQNMDNLDIASATFATKKDSNGNAIELDITMVIKNLTAPPPDPSFDPNLLGGGYWSVHWTFAGTAYEAIASGTGTSSSVMYAAGLDTGNEASAAFSTNTITGAFNPGAPGSILFFVPLNVVGSPSNGAQLTNTFAATHGAAAPPLAAGGVYYTAAADYAPSGVNPANPGYGVDYTVGVVQPCLNPNIPEAPIVPILAVIGGATAIGIGTRRYRRRPAAVA